MTPSTKNPKLEDILWESFEDGKRAERGEKIHTTHEQAQAQIQAALDWIIGDDEQEHVEPSNFRHRGYDRNQLRAEQRERLNQFCGKEQG